MTEVEMGKLTEKFVGGLILTLGDNMAALVSATAVQSRHRGK